MSKSTQCSQVLTYMLERGPINPLDAMREFGIMRLASRIADLKSMGHGVRSRMVSSRNRYGETVRYKEYWLEERA